MVIIPVRYSHFAIIFFFSARFSLSWQNVVFNLALLSDAVKLVFEYVQSPVYLQIIHILANFQILMFVDGECMSANNFKVLKIL